MECLSSEQNYCERADACVTVRLWRELDEAISSVVDRYTLEDLMSWSTESYDNYVI